MEPGIVGSKLEYDIIITKQDVQVGVCWKLCPRGNSLYFGYLSYLKYSLCYHFRLHVYGDNNIPGYIL